MNTVTVLIEGYIKAIEGRQLIPGVSADGARHVAGTVALIRGEHVIVVADPGMVTDRALIVAALAKEGVAPHEVTHVFVSHHHPDHTVNIALFPNAEVVDFWAVYKGDLWRDHADGYAIAPGITVLRTPGHTEEDASLVVETAEGTYVLTHLWWLADMTPETDPIAWKQEVLEARSSPSPIGLSPAMATCFRTHAKGKNHCHIGVHRVVLTVPIATASSVRAAHVARCATVRSADLTGWVLLGRVGV